MPDFDDSKVINRFATVTYCDDVRREVGNKLSLMGLYQKDLFVQEMPALLPKLCFLFNIYTPNDDPLRKLKLRTTYNDRIVIEFEAESDQLAKSAAEIRNQEGESGFLVLAINFILSPFEISEPGLLKTIVCTEREALATQALSIKEAQFNKE